MLKNFCKYQSLGNDIILFDWIDASSDAIEELLAHLQWPEQVKALCHRHKGIGADGIIILIPSPTALAELIVFNADGSHAQTCLNGMRCAAHYLHQKGGNQRISILSHHQYIDNEVCENGISTHLRAPRYEGEHGVIVRNESLQGHRIDVGNPHFVVCQRKSISWLSRWGALIERHDSFPQKTNVEFVWPNRKKGLFHLLVYERGCGITQACSSGAAAAVATLHHLQIVPEEGSIDLVMLGGILRCQVDHHGALTLFAPAHLVFNGTQLICV